MKDASVLSIVATIVLMVLQLIIGIASWLLRSQITRIYQRLDSIENTMYNRFSAIEQQMLTKSEFEMWRQGVKNGHTG